LAELTFKDGGGNDLEVHVCDRCGCYVADTAAHDRFHRAVEGSMKIARALGEWAKMTGVLGNG
jgi:hypothetical protein